jgi:magnesium transporter
MPHPLFGPEIRLMLQEHDTSGMATFCESLHPATVAEALNEEDFSPDEIWNVLQQTSIPNRAVIFEYLPLDVQVKLAEGAGRPQMARLIEQMSADDRANLLRRLPRQIADALLRLVDEADRRDIATLVKYAENTAGSLMTTDYAWLPANISAADALERLRLQAPNKETIYYVYILDDQRHLLGVVSLRDLILAPRQAPVRELMETEIVTVNVHDDPESLARDLARYDLLAIPVVDEQRRLVGIITHDDVLDVVVEEATEDAHRMGAVGPIDENYLETSFVTVWRKRAVWLACLFVAELFTFTALAHFEDAIAQVVVLSLFVPLCISTGGNSGSQAATLITRAMALGQVSLSDWARVLRHELLMGVVLGLTLGCIGFFRASLTPDSVRSSSPPRDEAFTVTVSKPLEVRSEHRPALLFGSGEDIDVATVPKEVGQVIRSNDDVVIALPEDTKLPEPTPGTNGELTYSFPKKCTLMQPPVNRWNLAWVIAQAVAAICLWGTLVGSMLPLVFLRLGVDPGIASSPFVATFVDVTGIVIYFSIATVYLL